MIIFDKILTSPSALVHSKRKRRPINSVADIAGIFQTINVLFNVFSHVIFLFGSVVTVGASITISPFLSH